MRCEFSEDSVPLTSDQGLGADTELPRSKVSRTLIPSLSTPLQAIQIG
jgi:hypothetical protein